MLARVTISDIKTGDVLGELSWDRRGNKKKGFVLSGFRVHINRKAMQEVSVITSTKAKLYLQTLYRLHKLKKIKKEVDLEMFTNIFIADHKPNVLFEGKKDFNFRAVNDFDVKLLRSMIESTPGFVTLNDDYFKREFILKLKEQKRKNK